ncbi:MAG: 16S rRNA (cytidine(1402)-2'-O)-methyltransferase [Acidimicrobiales bacterium]
MSSGSLVVVGTPIGHLGDMSPRAIEALTNASVIACEDTRRTGKLCSLLGIARPPFLVANEHTEVARSAEIIARIVDGETVALVSDAGMPGISDPGERLVRAVLGAGLDVHIVPGPTAMTTALVLSGLATDRFVFEGFLPRKGAERRRRLDEIADETRTTVFYESPKRIAGTLADLVQVCGPERSVAVARELTKLHEEVVRASLAEAAERFGREPVRGEIVVVLAGAASPTAEVTDVEILGLLRGELDAGRSTRDAVAAVVASTGLPKRRVYGLATTL